MGDLERKSVSEMTDEEILNTKFHSNKKDPNEIIFIPRRWEYGRHGEGNKPTTRKEHKEYKQMIKNLKFSGPKSEKNYLKNFFKTISQYLSNFSLSSSN